MAEVHDKIYWHDAFYEAVQLELADYRDMLDFENEHQLSKEALRMDVLIIKKEKNAEIKKNFGQIFKGYNIFEYKSETDSISIHDYNKVNGYALLYSAFEKIDTNDITITFVLTKHPRDLFKYLQNVRGLDITEPYNGVYYIKGELMPIQILESKKLSEDDNLFLKSLSSSLGVEDMLKVLTAYQRQERYDKNNVYIDRIMEANQEIMKEVYDMSAELKAIFLEAAEKKGWINEAIEQEKLEVARRFLKMGLSVEQVAEGSDYPIEKVSKLKEGL